MEKEQTEELQQLEAELKRLEIEEKRQDVESKKLKAELDRLQLGELKQQVEQKQNNKRIGQENAKKAIDDLAAMQARCNHHTGGHGAEAINFGQGDMKRPTCIGAQVFLDDRIKLSCGRCRAFCWSDDPDRLEWAKWVELWKESINTQMMVVGGLKIVRSQPVVAA